MFFVAFSILFLSITNSTIYASAYLGKKSFSVQHSFPTLWSDNSSETVTSTFNFEQQVIFNDICTLSMGKTYQFTFEQGLSVDSTHGGTSTSNDVSYEVYIKINGQKYYVNPWSSFIFNTSQADVFSFGVDVTMSTAAYFDSSSETWLPNFISCLLEGTCNVYIYELTEEEVSHVSGSTGIVNGLKDNKKSLDKANDLQKESNETSKGILGKITDFFGSFFENLKGLFVPEDGYFSDFFTRLNDFFADKLGMLYAPIDMFITFLNTIKDASSTDSGITFPELAWDGTVIIPETKFSFDTIYKDFPDLKEKIYFVTDVILVGAVLWLLQMKLKEVLEN